jgi:hypothetical protein
MRAASFTMEVTNRPYPLPSFLVQQVRIVNLAPVEFPLECYIKENLGSGDPTPESPYVSLGPS